MNSVVGLLLALTLVAVLAVLAMGVIGLVRGGPQSERRSNVLMRWRVALQAAAVALFALLMLVSGR